MPKPEIVQNSASPVIWVSLIELTSNYHSVKMQEKTYSTLLVHVKEDTNKVKDLCGDIGE